MNSTYKGCYISINVFKIVYEKEDNMNQEKIGKFISKCRKQKNLTQVEIAEKLGVSDKSVSKWETGKCMPD